MSPAGALSEFTKKSDEESLTIKPDEKVKQKSLTKKSDEKSDEKV